jgi:hypothetical protein
VIGTTEVVHFTGSAELMKVLPGPMANDERRVL